MSGLKGGIVLVYGHGNFCGPVKSFRLAGWAPYSPHLALLVAVCTAKAATKNFLDRLRRTLHSPNPPCRVRETKHHTIVSISAERKDVAQQKHSDNREVKWAGCQYRLKDL